MRLLDTLWKKPMGLHVQVLPARDPFNAEVQDMRLMIVVACVALGLTILAADGITSTPQQDTPKYTIKEVMKKAHGKDGILNKVKSEKASDAEAKTLVEMYVALSKSTPPKGDADDWKKKTGAMVEGAKLYVDGKKDDAVTKLNAATNCKACHAQHKG
jgi:hypothetical protein